MVAMKQADIFQRGLDNRWKGLRAVHTLEIDKKIEKHGIDPCVKESS